MYTTRTQNLIWFGLNSMKTWPINNHNLTGQHISLNLLGLIILPLHPPNLYLAAASFFEEYTSIACEGSKDSTKYGSLAPIFVQYWCCYS